MTKKRWIRCGVLAVVAVVILGVIAVDKSFYDPYEDFTTTSTTFTALNQLLSPTATEGYLQREEESLLAFGNHTVHFQLQQFSYTRSPYEPRNEGTITYDFGKPVLSAYADDLGLGQLTCKQEVFLSSEALEEQSVSKEQVYEVWVRFAVPMDSQTFGQTYDWLLNNEQSRPKKSGILWMPVQTSDDPAALCLGVAGNLSFYHMNPDSTLKTDMYRADMWARENVFLNAVRFLVGHPEDTEMFWRTGLWSKGEAVNFQERQDYVQENGFQYLGFVAYIKGADLPVLADTPALIVKLCEDK